MSGIIQYARIYNFWGPATIGYSNKVFNEKNIFYADSTLFQVLSYKFIKGNKETAFQKPHSIVITESIAKKYFGDLNPINKILNLDNSYNLTVTGVIKNIPSNSHLQFDFLAFEPDRIKNFGSMLNHWYDINVTTYILLSKNFSSTELENKLPEFIENHAGKGESNKIKFKTPASN